MKNQLRAFKVNLDVNRYQYFLWDLDSNATAATYDRLSCDGRPKGRRWKPAPVYIYKPRHKKGDFWDIGLGNGGLGIAPWAMEKVEALQMFAEMAGELLPVEYKDQLFTLLNITECIECLDSKQSEWRTLGNGRKYLRTPFFHANRMCASTLFKSAHAPSEIYCIEYSRDPEEEFKACVEHHNLKGLLFEEVMIG